jgi:hypothetical protein
LKGRQPLSNSREKALHFFPQVRDRLAIAREMPERQSCAALCLKCAGHSFELATSTPLGTSHKLTVVQCSGCGTPIGVPDPAAGAQIDALKNQIAAMDKRFNRIAKALQR